MNTSLFQLVSTLTLTSVRQLISRDNNNLTHHQGWFSRARFSLQSYDSWFHLRHQPHAFFLQFYTPHKHLLLYLHVTLVQLIAVVCLTHHDILQTKEHFVCYINYKNKMILHLKKNAKTWFCHSWKYHFCVFQWNIYRLLSSYREICTSSEQPYCTTFIAHRLQKYNYIYHGETRQLFLSQFDYYSQEMQTLFNSIIQFTVFGDVKRCSSIGHTSVLWRWNKVTVLWPCHMWHLLHWTTKDSLSILLNNMLILKNIAA